jgi:predicted CXXCH cytochrome family protein
VCLNCHGDEFKKAQGPGIQTHAPYARKDCLTCHDPHASNYPSQQVAATGPLCLKCHASVAQARKGAASVHEPLNTGQCTACHSPHSAARPKLMVGEAQAVCLTCHQGLIDSIKSKPSHQPAKQGKCLECHLGHTSARPALLTNDDPRLCQRCHPDNEASRKAHGGIAIKSSPCLGCHRPHFANAPGLIKTYQHDPFARRDCVACHEGGAQK